MKDLEKLINTGERPSRLELGQLWSGEASGDAAERLSAQAAEQPAASDYLAGLDQARDQLPSFDPEILRKRAFRMSEDDQREVERQAERAQRTAPAWWRTFLPVTAAVAAAAVAIVTLIPDPSTRSQHVTPYLADGTKGSGGIEFVLLRDGEVHTGSEDETHWAGDRIQFRYRTTGESTLVMVSVDGRDDINLYYPDSGDEPLAIIPGERVTLDGSIVLDDAPDFELILAYFGHSSVGVVLDEVEAIYDEEGREGLLLLAEDYPDVDSIFLHKGERRPGAGPE
jgi:hypothetical protein